MTGKRLLKRLLTVFVGMLCFFMFLHAVDADAETAVGHQVSTISQNLTTTGFHEPDATLLR